VRDGRAVRNSRRTSGRHAGVVSRSSKAAGPGADAAAAATPGAADPETVARLICLRLLTSAPRTRAQLAAALRRRGVPDDAAEAVLARLAEVGLIDDAMFARAWVESRHHGRGLARRALAAELGRRGVAREEVSAAVAGLSAETELATARTLVQRRLSATAGLAPPARIRKLVGVLARKGYSPAMAFRVVREVLEEAGDDQLLHGLEDADVEPDLTDGW